MQRSELAHLIRAAGAIANDPEIVVIGDHGPLPRIRADTI
jgi:hypothetical protein